MTDPKVLSDAVNAAKEAVRDLEEPLRMEAFKVILQNELISRTGVALGGKRRHVSKPDRSSNKSTGNRREKGTAPISKVSSLKFSIEELRKLKNYCERFELNGTEMIAFIIANFLREHTDLKSINAADIAYCYRQLVSQRVIKKHAVNDISDWVRALHWLTAPSRRKEWLTKADGNYVVSNSGLLRFQQLEAQAKSKQAG